MTKKERLLAYYIDHTRDESLTIERLVGSNDSRIQEYAACEHTAILYPVRPIRTEHPHCAIYKKPVEIGQGSAERTTIYTPDGRLHSDYLLEGGQKGQVVKPYIKQAKHLSTLLFFLKDVKAYWDQGIYEMALSRVGDLGLLEIGLSKTPIQYLLQYMEESLLMDLLEKEDKLLLRCIKEAGRILRDEIAILVRSGVAEDLHLAYIDDELHHRIDQAQYHDYYLKYYHKLAKSMPNMTITVSAREAELPEGMVAGFDIDALLTEESMQPTG